MKKLVGYKLKSMVRGCLAVAFMAPIFAVAGEHEHEVRSAVAALAPTSGQRASGIVRFERSADGLSVKGEIAGLGPGEHGFHIHEFGDCSSPDAESAGSHFNPGHGAHGGREGAQRHAGDFGNITADKDGVARFSFEDNEISLSGENSILGRALVVHEKHDDLKTNPSGGSGARLACGVIGVAK